MINDSNDKKDLKLKNEILMVLIGVYFVTRK